MNIAEFQRAVVSERARQDAKHGPQAHCLYKWVAILTEETGEVAHALLEGDAAEFRFVWS